MRVTLNIEKRYVYIFLTLCLVIIGIVAVNAYDTWSPPVMGHTPGEINPGLFGTGDGSSFYTFQNPVSVEEKLYVGKSGVSEGGEISLARGDSGNAITIDNERGNFRILSSSMPGGILFQINSDALTKVR